MPKSDSVGRTVASERSGDGMNYIRRFALGAMGCIVVCGSVGLIKAACDAWPQTMAISAALIATIFSLYILGTVIEGSE
jgi:hypothetical protein